MGLPALDPEPAEPEAPRVVYGLREVPAASPEKRKERKLVMPSTEMIARFLSASLGGAIVGSILLGPLPMLGAWIGAALGAGVVALRTRHAF